jgi:predicted phosphodiesterase
VKSRDDVSPYDYVLFASVNGYVVDSQYREINYKSLANGFTRPSYDRDLNKTNADLKLCCGKCETFLYFSDPHVAGTNNSYSFSWQQDTLGLKKRVEELSVNSVNKIICGGDWLNELDTRLTALEKLSYINGMFDNEKFINVVGNHDLNYDGIYDTGYAKYTGELTKDEVQYTFMPKRNKLYYTEESSPNVEYFVLDSGNDQHPMTDYRWEQIDWLAVKLLTSQKNYGIICIHIYSSGGSDPSEWTEYITPMATALMQLLLACNARTSVTLNGRTYDFTSASIRISFVLSGHTHYDYVDSSQSIPVVTITKGFKNKVYNFDLGVADFTNKKLYMTRVGAGSDRIITIA